MSGTIQIGTREPSTNVPTKQGRGRILANLSRKLAILGVFALVVLLLGWGFSAMQWTMLITNNNVRDAIATSSFVSQTAAYAIPLGAQRVYTICLLFQASSTSCGSGSTVSIPNRHLPTPVSNMSTTVDDYVVFSFSSPNGTAVTVWYSGPDGNLTQDCSGAYPMGEITCTYEPAPQGVRTGPFPAFFKIFSPGNYSLHLLSTQCSYTPNCSTTTAVGTLSLECAYLTYSRPYWLAGLTTVIVAGVAGASIIIAIAYLAMTSHRKGKQQRGPNSSIPRFPSSTPPD